VTIAPSAKKSSDIHFCDENILYNLLYNYNFLIFLTFATLYQSRTAKPKHIE